MDTARYTLGVGEEYERDDIDEDVPLELEEEGEETVPTSIQSINSSDAPPPPSDARRPPPSITNITVQTQSSSSSSSSQPAPIVFQPQHLILTPHQDVGDEDDLDLDETMDGEGNLSPRVAALVGELVTNRSLFSLRGVHFAIATVTLCMALVNFITFALSTGSGDHCSSLGTFILCVGLGAAFALVVQTFVLARAHMDPSWLDSKGAKLVAGACAVVFVALLFYSFFSFSLLSHGACGRDTLLRQVAMVDGIVLLGITLLVGAYAIVKWKLPHYRLGSNTLWSSRVKFALGFIALALCVANLVSLGVNGQGGRTSYHRVVQWSPCPDPVNCANSTPITKAESKCVDQDGAIVQDEFCTDLPAPPMPIIDSITCPKLCESPPKYDETEIYLWTWEMPSCSAACVPPEYHQGVTIATLAPSVFCFNLHTREKVGDSLCRELGTLNPARKYHNQTDLICDPTTCTECLALRNYDWVYTGVCLLGLIMLSAEVMGGTRDGEGGGDMSQTKNTAPSGVLQDSTQSSPPPRRTIFACLLHRFPRVAFALLALCLGVLLIYSLVAASEFPNVQCRDFLAVSIVNVMVTINASVFAVVFLVRSRLQVLTAPNPFESIGLL